MTLRVLEIFDSLQGEGYWTGVPITFVRLAGCNAPDLGLDCVRWCDTIDAWAARVGEDVEIEAIVGRVTMPRMCLTGGEPLLQIEGLAALLGAAHERDIRVHLETNGTIDPAPPPAAGAAAGAARLGASATNLDFDWVVVSPKPPAYLVSPGWEGLVDELKLVADESLDAATAERLAAAHPGAFVCIQPVAAPPGAGQAGVAHSGSEGGDQVGRASMDRAIDLVMTHPEWRLSLQTHKLLGIR